MSLAMVAPDLEIEFLFIFYQFNSCKPEPCLCEKLVRKPENAVSKEDPKPARGVSSRRKTENKLFLTRESTLAAAGCENIIQFEERCGSWSYY
jgi:hypothetical protein